MVNYNYENVQIIMNGAELLYSMLCELIEEIGNLPGCKMTAGIKYLSANASAASAGIYQTMRNIASDELLCDECEDHMDECADIPSNTDLTELLATIDEMISSDKPVSISADIYINKGKNDEKESEE